MGETEVERSLLHPFYKGNELLSLNVHNWWECSGDKFWAMNLRQSNFVTQGDECYDHGWNQAKINLELIQLNFQCTVFVANFGQIIAYCLRSHKEYTNHCIFSNYIP